MDFKYEGKSRKAEIMAGFVAKNLSAFCDQNSEFKQAVEQGGTFTECMDAIASRTGSAVSDEKVLKIAVEFYFPTAKVEYNIAIDLGDGGFSNSSKKLEFSLEDLI